LVQGAGAAESELATRCRDITTKFAEALSLARPLASVNDEALQRVHPGQQTEYRYKFSEVPFAGQPVADALFEVLRNNPRIDQATKDNYHRSLSDEDSVTRVDIFGPTPTTRRWCSTRCSSPLLSSGPRSPGRAGGRSGATAARARCRHPCR
jgi:hypothetical protein